MPEPTAPDGSVGHRLTRQRTLCGLTRPQLATAAELDPDLITHVEHGTAPASAAFTAAVAYALGVEVDALYGQPYGPGLTDPGADHAVIPALRAALDTDQTPPPDTPPLTAAQLCDRLDDCDQDRAAARYRQLGAALPELLVHGHALAAGAGTDTATAAALLADAFLLAQTVAYRFGHSDLALLANQCARDAATASTDPLRAAVVAAQRALLRLHRGDHYGVLLLLEHTHDQISEHTSPAADAIRTALHLHEALTLARIGNPERAHHHLDIAADLLARDLPTSPYYTVLATEANLNIHTVAIPLELGDATTALAHAEQIKIPTGEEPARVGRYWIDLARAWALHGDHLQALDALDQADQIAPQLTRYHPQARETVHLLTEHDRRTTDSLADFAHWAGITL